MCGGDGSACVTTSTTLKDEVDMTMGYNDLVMIPPGATNIRIAEVSYLTMFSCLLKGKSLQQLFGTEKYDRSLLPQWRLEDRLPSAV